MMSASELEDIFAMQLNAVGLDGYLREFKKAIPGRRYRFDFAFVSGKWQGKMLLIEINGGTHSKGGHSSYLGIKRDYEKSNLAVKYGWKVLQFDADMVKSGQALEFTEKILRGEK
jgi:very-short-patch-repair endonuclease